MVGCFLCWHWAHRRGRWSAWGSAGKPSGACSRESAMQTAMSTPGRRCRACATMDATWLKMARKWRGECRPQVLTCLPVNNCLSLSFSFPGPRIASKVPPRVCWATSCWILRSSPPSPDPNLAGVTMSYPISLPLCAATGDALATLSHPTRDIWELEMHNGLENRLTTEFVTSCLSVALDLVERDWRSNPKSPGALIITGSKDSPKFFSNGKRGVLVKRQLPSNSMNTGLDYENAVKDSSFSTSESYTPTCQLDQ